MNSIFYCPGDLALFNTFDLSYAPTLLYYSYIPIVIASLFLAVFILIKKHFSLESKLLFSIAVSFSLWVLNIMMQWITVPAQLNYFELQITPFIEILIPIFSLYFVVVFLEKKDAGIKMKLFLSAIASSVFILLPTSLNAISFDVLNCQANLGPLIYYVYGFEVFSVFLVLYLGVMAYRSSTDSSLKKQILFFIPGVMLFLGIFSVGQIFGELTKLYEINLIGPIGMLCFIGILAYMIVKYQTFNIKMFATQILVIGIAFLIGSRLFYSTTIDGLILSAVTLVAFLASGFFLVKSVRGEIKQREDLADTTSLITHQIRGVFTNTKSGLSNIIEGSYGPVPPELMSIMELMFKSQVAGVKEVETFLQAQKVESGTIQYEKKPFDLKAVVEDKFAQEKPRTDTKGLQYELQIDAGDYMITGDQVYLTQVIANLIDNAIRYTEKGSIKVQLSRKDSSVLYSVKDSGIGIPDEDKDKMFTKYGHGKDSRKTNADTAGLGLYIVHGIVTGHGGKIWYETKVGEGTTFFVELPISQKASAVA